MCELFGIEVGNKDTRQILIEKLRSKDAVAAEAPEAAPKKSSSRGRTGRNRKTGKDEREQREKRAAVKAKTEEIMDNPYASRPITDLAPEVKKRKPKVHTGDHTDGTVNEALEKIDRELAASMVDPRHSLKGRVIGPKSTETREVPGVGRVSFVNYMVEYGPYNVLIPSFYFWYDWQDQDKPPANRLFEQGAGMEGLEIEFNMTNKEVGVTTEIYGTRLYSTKIQRCEEWYAKLPDGEWYIQEGDIVKATIVRTRKYDVVIEYKGAEAVIPVKNLSHFFDRVVDSKKYKTGKKINVKVSNIKREPVPRNTARFDYPVSFEASAKDAMVDPQIVNFDKYDEGDLLPGRVAHIMKDEETGKQLYFVIVKDQITIAADLGAGVGRNYVPEEGSEVKILIREKKRKGYQFYGLIVSVRTQDRDQEEFAVLDI